MQPAHHRQRYNGAHISLGSMKYAAGAVVTMLLAEKIDSPEKRYLVLAAVGALMGAVSTAWRDHVKAQREECRERVAR
jgi:hypothetical protein